MPLRIGWCISWPQADGISSLSLFLLQVRAENMAAVKGRVDPEMLETRTITRYFVAKKLFLSFTSYLSIRDAPGAALRLALSGITS